MEMERSNVFSKLVLNCSIIVSASRSPPGLGSNTASRSPPGPGKRCCCCFCYFPYKLGNVVHILPTLGALSGPLFQPWGYLLDPLAACFAIKNGVVAPKVSQERPKAPAPVSVPLLGDNVGYVF